MAKLQRETGRGFAVTELSGSTVTNTTAETNLFTQVIPAGKMGAVKELSFELLCMLTTPLLSLPTLTLRLKYGASVLTVSSGTALAVSQTNEPFILKGKIVNKSVNSQVVYARIEQSTASAPLVLGVSSSFKAAKWAIDTSADQTFSLTSQFSLLSGTTSISVENVTIELS